MKRLLLIALLLAGCATTTAPPLPPVQAVPTVDLQRYLGTWYEIARYPNSFQDGRGRRCVAVTARYDAREDGQIGVTNRCLDATDGDREIVATARAYAVEDSGNAKLRVTFFWPFYGDYWVIGLDPAYRWAVVGTPSREFLWVLSRVPDMPAGAYVQAITAARAQGFEIGRLQPTPQPPR
jgi:apolipoprotein D and lipocalin family protein